MVFVPQSRFDARITTDRAAWQTAGLALTVVGLALCAAFWREAQGAYEVWTGSTAYNHCFLVLPVALYLAWQRRDIMQRVTPKPDLRALALLVPLSLLWLMVALLSILELQQLLVMAMFQVIALAMLGWRVYRPMLMPFLYLFFLIPFGYFLVPYLQEWTAAFAVEALKLVGIPVYSDGMFIEVPSGTFVVAEACAGLRFLIASVAFGVFFAAIVYRSRLRWAVFIALSIVVPIIANGFRAFGIIALSEVTGNATAVEADHIIYGWVFFSAVTLLLIVIGLRFAEDRQPAATLPPQAQPHPIATGPARVIIAGVLGILLAASGPAYAGFRSWRASDVALDGALPVPASPWKPTPASFGWTPVVENPDRAYHAVYSNGSDDVLLYVALYKDAGLHNNLVRGVNDIVDGKRWRLATSGSATVRIGGRESPVMTSEIAGPEQRLVVWSFYLVDGHIAASPLAAKLLQLRHLLSAGSGVDSFVAVATPEGPALSHPENVLRTFLAKFTPPGS